MSNKNCKALDLENKNTMNVFHLRATLQEKVDEL